MGAPKAREILQVCPYENDTGDKRCKVLVRAESDNGTWVALSSLTRQELIRAVKLVWPDINGAHLVQGASVEDMANALRNRDRSMVDGSDIKLIPESKSVEPKAPEPPQDDDMATLARLLGKLGGGVDMHQVRTMVRAEVTEAIEHIPPRKVEIVFPDRNVTLPDNHHAMLPDVIQALSAGCHVMLVGPAGSGKSTIAFQAAEAMGLPCQSFSFDPQTPKSQIFGFVDANSRVVRTPCRDAYEHGHVFLCDEIDNGNPGGVASLNQLLSNGHAAFADSVVARHESFRCVATANTFGRGGDRKYVGRNALDMATLDRFAVMEIDYDERLERSLATGIAANDDQLLMRLNAWVDRVQTVRRKVDQEKLNVIVSPRASIDGAKLIACGMPEHKVADYRLFAGMPADLRRKVEA